MIGSGSSKRLRTPPGLWARAKRFQCCTLCSTITLGLHAVRRWGSSLEGQNLRAHRFSSPPPPFFGNDIGTLLVVWLVDLCVSWLNHFVKQSVKWADSPFFCLCVSSSVRYSISTQQSLNQSVRPSVRLVRSVSQ